MDHRGLRARLTGAGCASCGAVVPPHRIAVLADRGDIAFVELDCAACTSRTVSVVIAADRATPSLDTAVEPAPPAGPDRARALDERDVEAMARFLADWTGDLRSLLDDRGPSAGRGGRGGRA